MASMKWMDGFSWVESTGGMESAGGMTVREQIQQAIQQQGTQMYGDARMHGIQASPVETLGSGEVGDRYKRRPTDEEMRRMAVDSNYFPDLTKPVEITDHTPEAVEVAVLEKPRPSALTEIKTDLKEYAELAAIVGIAPTELTIEAFKAFLHEHDIPVFNLKEVIAYMDDKAKRESKDQAGWEWRPLREKDRRNIWFGRSAWRGSDRRGNQGHGSIVTPASDLYSGNAQRIYDKLVPLHALKKVALIEKHFGDKVGMFVCDYAPIPAIPHPDPFLMAVIANPKVKEGEGRFIIDLWDEPGFGLTSQLK